MKQQKLERRKEGGRLNILVACEESQAVCNALRKRGHRAFSCDVVPCSGGHPEWHIMGDCLPLLGGRCIFMTMDWVVHENAGRWDMIIAFPPCTYMTNASACRMYPSKGVIDEDRLKKGMEAKAFFMSIYNADCDRIAIENPRPLNIIGLPQETQRIQPWMFGEPFTKLTYLWLKGLPELRPTEIVKDIATPFVNAGSFSSNGQRRKRLGIKHVASQRSKTFKGVAEAMAQQWAG